MPKIFRPFETAMDFLWRWEGGFSNDPADPGGATNLGITLRTAIENGMDIDLDGDVDVDDIKKMTPEAAMAVYKNKYWSPIFNVVPNLPWSVAIAGFDAAVNCGTERAKKWVVDAMKTDNPVRAVNEFRRIHYLNIIARNPSLAKFRNGWNNRVNDLSKMLDILDRDVKDGTIAPPPL